MSLEFVRVKEEPECETNELYTQHEIKQELVVGPEQLQPPDVTCPDIDVPRSSVKKLLKKDPPSKIKIEVEFAQQEEIVPPRKKRKHSHFTENEKLMIINVFKYVGKTWPLDKYRSKQEMKDETAEIVGVSRSAVYKILKEYTETETVQPAVVTKRLTIVEKLDDFDKSRIRQIVHSFYLKGKLPTANKVLHVVNADKSLPNLGLTSLKKILDHLKFKYVKRKENNALIDHDDVALCRINYLEKMKSFRQQGRPIYYLAETWVHAGGLSTRTTPKGPRLMVVHIAGESGFLPGSELVIESKGKGDHKSMNAKREHWFQTLLPKLEKYAVVVMNAGFLSRREKIPVTTWRKLAIQHWLASKGVSFDDEEKKVRLLEKVKTVKSLYNSYVMDEKAKEFGAEVLRLPLYYCELNPIDIIWADFMSDVKRNSTFFKMSDVKQILLNLNSISADKWRKCMSHVKMEETKYESLDSEIDKTIDSCVTHMSGSSKPSTSDSSSDTEAESDLN